MEKDKNVEVTLRESVCQRCGKKTLSVRSDRKFCSDACRQANDRDKKKKQADVTDETLRVTKELLRKEKKRVDVTDKLLQEQKTVSMKPLIEDAPICRTETGEKAKYSDDDLLNLFRELGTLFMKYPLSQIDPITTGKWDSCRKQANEIVKRFEQKFECEFDENIVNYFISKCPGFEPGIITVWSEYRRVNTANVWRLPKYAHL